MLVGLGMKAELGAVAPIAVVLAAPNAITNIFPVPTYYIITGDYNLHHTLDYSAVTAAGQSAKVEFTAGKTMAGVIHLPDGTWEVQMQQL